MLENNMRLLKDVLLEAPVNEIIYATVQSNHCVVRAYKKIDEDHLVVLDEFEVEGTKVSIELYCLILTYVQLITREEFHSAHLMLAGSELQRIEAEIKTLQAKEQAVRGRMLTHFHNSK